MVDIKVDSANAYILVIDPDNGYQAGYTSPSTSTNTYPADDGSNVYAFVISPQEVQLWADNGFEGGGHNFNVEVFDPSGGSVTLTVTHLDYNGADVWSPKTWSLTLAAGQSYTAYSGIDVNGFVMGGGITFPLPEYALGGFLALAACLAACAVFKKRKSLPLFKTN
ncbi:MAG: hypothetical protein ABSG33_04140 [Candidatus Bathyarchaeia archaeon]|jgi:hypothetical protein